jgi:hypothetical protein
MRVLNKMLVMWLALMPVLAIAVETQELLEKFNRKYQSYLTAESQALLPLPPLDLQEWKYIQENRPLRLVFREPDRYYNNKVYTLMLYQVTDSEEYYLNAKGGFWGMDELAYGPFKETALE